MVICHLLSIVDRKLQGTKQNKFLMAAFWTSSTYDVLARKYFLLASRKFICYVQFFRNLNFLKIFPKKFACPLGVSDGQNPLDRLEIY